MDLEFSFFFNSILLGTGLAMDAFLVSLANGLSEPSMKKKRMCLISGTFATFQILMPLIGWALVSTAAQYFKIFESFIPFIALALLSYIGGKMLYSGITSKDKEEVKKDIGFKTLVVQGIATSIDALSVGFTIANYSFQKALISCLVIGIVTFIICFAGLIIGKKAGTKLSGKADILGGAILIFIGLEIFITNII